VPSITELICDLGHTEQLVGCTRFCVHPQSVVSKVTKVGGTKNPKLEKIKELQPDLILANKEENEREHIESLAERISVWVTDVKTVDDNLDMIRSLASIFAKEQKGEELCSTIDSGFHQLSTESNPIPAAYLIWRQQ
jgi:ABC-type Fe3+-hydroxamate transport system substrate-binding protein